MSFFSQLFKHHTAPPTPGPIQGRDAEFRATVTFLYRQELGRDPSEAELDEHTGWVHLAKYPPYWTAEQLAAAIHASDEAKAYRERPSPSATTAATRPLVGRLRIVTHAAAKTHSYADDTGPRRVLFATWFPALRIWRDDQATAIRMLDLIAAAGYQGIRIFRALGADRNNGDDDSPWWSGRTVNPSWAVDALIPFLEACHARGLSLHLTSGHKWNSTSERLAFAERVCDAIRAKGLQQRIALWEGDNELYQNADFGCSEQQFEVYRQEFEKVKAILGPDQLCAAGDCGGNESPDIRDGAGNVLPGGLTWGARHSDVTVVHGTRYMPDGIKRTFGLWYYEGNPGYWPMPFWQGEPTGPGEGVSVARCDDPGYLCALYGMAQLTGQGLVAVNGAGIWFRRELDADPYFRDIPRWLAHLPEDIATWGHWLGHRIWWWIDPTGTRVATATAGVWPYEPDHPLKTWKVIGLGGTVTEGEGKLPTIATGALIVGTIS